MRRTFQITAHLQIEDVGETPMTPENIADFAKGFIGLEYSQISPYMGTKDKGENATLVSMEISWPTIREIQRKK